MDMIIAHGIVLTCDVANRCGRYAIAVRNGRIVDVAERLEALTKDNPNAVVVDASDKLIVPGFVNAHHHGASVLLREATGNVHFALWKDDQRLSQATTKFVHSSSHDDVRKVYQAAYVGHLRSGTTCVGEFPPPLDEEGFSRMLEGIHVSGITPVVALQGWDHIRQVQRMKSHRPRCLVNVGEEQDLTVYSFEQLGKAAKELSAPLLAHIAETAGGAAIIRENFQRDCFVLLNAFSLLQSTSVLVHANHATEDDVRTIKSANAGVVICARSTAAKQTGYPALRHLAKHNVRLCIGTDWDNVDMSEELRFLYQLPRLVPGLRQFSAVELLRMATVDGAHSLGLGGEMGSIEQNKRADLVFFNLADSRLPVVRTTSEREWAKLLIEHLGAGDITDVMIEGKFRIRHREMIGINERAVRDEMRALLSNYFAAPAPVSVPAPSPTNVLNFVERLSGDESLGSYEAGFESVREIVKLNEIVEPSPGPHPFADLPKQKRDPIKPELPKDTRRVFGEDEDF